MSSWPPSVVNPHPPCRKSDSTLLNCLQPIVILLPSLGSTAIDGSFAASPTMLLPRATTLKPEVAGNVASQRSLWLDTRLALPGDSFTCCVRLKKPGYREDALASR